MARHPDMTDERLLIEKFAMKYDREKYLECMNNKPLIKRKTMREQRDGLYLFGGVYLVIRLSEMKEEQETPW
jgi:hypothetical protein